MRSGAVGFYPMDSFCDDLPMAEYHRQLWLPMFASFAGFLDAMRDEVYMPPIDELLVRDKLPILDAIHFADGRSYPACLDDSKAAGVSFGAVFDLQDLDVDSVAGFARIDLHWPHILLDGSRIQLGEGGYGSEGFILHSGADGGLRWVLYFEYSNPFSRCSEIAPGLVELESTSRVMLRLQVADPLAA